MVAKPLLVTTVRVCYQRCPLPRLGFRRDLSYVLFILWSDPMMEERKAGGAECLVTDQPRYWASVHCSRQDIGWGALKLGPGSYSALQSIYHYGVHYGLCNGCLWKDRQVLVCFIEFKLDKDCFDIKIHKIQPNQNNFNIYGRPKIFFSS